MRGLDGTRTRDFPVWTAPELNRVPLPCEGSALPGELAARDAQVPPPPALSGSHAPYGLSARPAFRGWLADGTALAHRHGHAVHRALTRDALPAELPLRSLSPGRTRTRISLLWSLPDLNRRPSACHADALPGCAKAPRGSIPTRERGWIPQSLGPAAPGTGQPSV